MITTKHITIGDILDAEDKAAATIKPTSFTTAAQS